MNGNNILLVEDDANDMDLAKAVFSRTGWHVVEARDIAGAQRILRKTSRFRLACVDLKLGDGDGAHLVRWIKENHPHIPIVVVTGYMEERRRALLSDCGAVFLFQKPFTSHDLQYLLNFMDVTEAIFKRGRKIRPSFVTTGAGLSVVACGFWQMYRHPDPEAVALVLAGVGLIGALDSSVLKKLITGGKEKEE